MKKLSTYLLVAFMVMFWIFRIVLAFTNSIGIDMGFRIANINIEVILLFVNLVLILLVAKRKMIGAIAYLLVNVWYFGPTMLAAFTTLSEGSAGKSACQLQVYPECSGQCSEWQPDR